MSEQSILINVCSLDLIVEKLILVKNENEKLEVSNEQRTESKGNDF